MPHITLKGQDTAFDCGDDDTILRAALRAGYGFPYECNVGSCGNCRFDLISGAVRHRRADPPGLSERDRQRGRYLGCQAEPLGDCEIKVTFRDHYKSLHRPQQTRGRYFAVEDHTHDIREFRFRLDQPTRFLPGQYALLDVPGVEGARAYSMCNVSESGDEWHFQIKRMPGGACSTALFDRLALGDTIGLDGPYGMAYLRENAPRDILCLAGGSGLSPMVSITRAAAASPALAGRSLHFLYGGRAARDIAGEPMLRSLPGYAERIFYHPALSMPDSADTWAGHVGFVPDVAQQMFGHALSDYEIYFAGPPAMAEAIQRILVAAKVPPAQVHYDQFY